MTFSAKSRIILPRSSFAIKEQRCQKYQLKSPFFITGFTKAEGEVF